MVIVKPSGQELYFCDSCGTSLSAQEHEILTLGNESFCPACFKQERAAQARWAKKILAAGKSTSYRVTH